MLKFSVSKHNQTKTWQPNNNYHVTLVDVLNLTSDFIKLHDTFSTNVV